MACQRSAPAQARLGRPVLEVADIFRAHGEVYRRRHLVTPDQDKVMRAIVACRTEILGGHLEVCDQCGYAQPAYNSCRNRHCPKCQSLAQARWIGRRIERLLPTHYFHVVFTLPRQLRPLAQKNREQVFDLLFTAASQTLLELGADPRHLGGQLGITAVLHTWTRELTFHPHLHCVVTGGGLSPGGDKWVATSKKFLFPVKVMSRLFRGKFLAALTRAVRQGKLDLGGLPIADTAAFEAMRAVLYGMDWVVYAKRPFASTERVFRYLGRYTHRVGISNQRLQAMDEAGVRFATKNGKTITLAPEEFIRRFLQHVLPTGFAKIRHYGLLAPANATTRLEVARRLLEAGSRAKPVAAAAEPVPTAPVATSWQEQLAALTGEDITLCPACGKGTMVACAPDQPTPAASPPLGRDTS